MPVPTGWQRQFDDPIDLPDGRTLVTLRPILGFDNWTLSELWARHEEKRDSSRVRF
jgi:hypothetical protein